MLQKIRDRLTGWIALAILGLIGVTFVFVGGANFAFTGNNYAAKVDGVDIGIGQFQAAYRQQLQENPQIASMSSENRLLIRTRILEQLIQQQVIDNYLDDAGIQISDEQVAELIQQVPDFQVDGKFDRDTYRSILTANGYDPALFEEAQRTTLRRSQLQRAIRVSSVVAPSDYRRFLNLAYEQRVVSTATIDVAAVEDLIEVTEEMIVAYYDDNPLLFQLEETADVEYVVVSRSDVAADVTVTEEQIRDYYDQNRDRYLQDEQRQARHILIPFESDEEAAEAAANDLLARINTGESFEELAMSQSKDGATAPQGGDMGLVTRTQLDGDLGDAIFSMVEGELRGPVKSAFGFHIIRLDKIDERGPLPLEQIRPALVTELQEEGALDLYAALESRMNNALFDANEIQAVGDAVSKDVVRIDGFSRAGAEPFAGNQVAIDAIFDPSVLSGEQMSELIEVDANRTAVFSVVQHNPATRQPLADVRDQIRESLRQSRGEELMAARAKAMLDALDAGEEFAAAAESVGAAASVPTIMTRNADDADPYVAVAVFTALKPTETKPTRGSTPNGNGGYTVYSIDAVVAGRPESIPLADRDAGRNALVDQYGVGDFVGFVHALRAEADIVINQDMLAAEDLL